MPELPEHISHQSSAGAPEEEGIIVKVAEDLARVKIGRGASCATCAAAGKCAFNDMGRKNWEVWAKNKPGAQEGDRVRIAIGAGRYLLIAALVFIVPVAVLILTYVILTLAGMKEQMAVGVSVMLAFMSYFLVRMADRRAAKIAQYDVVEIL